MRIQDMAKIVRDSLAPLAAIRHEIPDGRTIHLKNLGVVLPCISNLEAQGILPESVARIRKIPYVNNFVGDVMVAEMSVGERFLKEVDALRNRLAALAEALAEQFDEDGVDSIIVEFGETKNLTDFVNLLDRTRKVLEAVVMNSSVQDGKLELVGVDRGSVIFELALSAGGLLMFGKILRYYYTIREAELRLEKQRLEVDSMRIDVEMKKTLFSVYENEMLLNSKDYFEALVAENLELDAEQRRRFEYAVGGLKELHSEGVRFRCSQNAPEPVALLFDTSGQKHLPEPQRLLSAPKAEG